VAGSVSDYLASKFIEIEYSHRFKGIETYLMEFLSRKFFEN